VKWRWSLLHCIRSSKPVLEYMLDTATKSPLHHDDNLANNTITISGIAIHQSSRRHQVTALHSSTALEALAKVRAQFQAKLPASSGKARLPGPVTSDHTLLNTSLCLDHTENIFADQLVI
jgi:hypothetical protein